MVTKNDIKFINNLKHKKFRDLNNCFVVEGIKSINDFIDSNYKLIKLYSVDCSHFNNLNNQIQMLNYNLQVLTGIGFLILKMVFYFFQTQMPLIL